MLGVVEREGDLMVTIGTCRGEGPPLWNRRSGWNGGEGCIVLGAGPWCRGDQSRTRYTTMYNAHLRIVKGMGLARHKVNGWADSPEGGRQQQLYERLDPRGAVARAGDPLSRDNQNAQMRIRTRQRNVCVNGR